MQARLKIEKLPRLNESEKTNIVEETELSQLSFWNEPQQNFLPNWGHFHDRFGYFKIAGIVLILVISCLSGYFAWKCWSSPVVTTCECKVKDFPAPIVPAKIQVREEKNTVDHAVYHRHEKKEEQPVVLEDEDGEELTSLQDEDLPYNMPEKEEPSSHVMKNSFFTTETVSKKKIKQQAIDSKLGAATCGSESFYINVGTFSSHEAAIETWCQLKQDKIKQRHLHELEPMIRIVPSEQGQQYQLLAGPVGRKEGLLKCQILSAKGRAMTLIGMNTNGL